MSEPSQPTHPMTVGTADECVQLEAFLDTYRVQVEATLDGLTEQEVRRRLVPSSTTLLGLVKHLVFMQTVWFHEAVTGTPLRELGIPESVEDSFALAEDDTIQSVLETYRASCQSARQQMVGRSLDDVVTGHQIGPITLRWVHLHCLRELAHHCGHADILREQILAARSTTDQT